MGNLNGIYFDANQQKTFPTGQYLPRLFTSGQLDKQQIEYNTTSFV